MKTKKEIIADYLDSANEAIIRIELSEQYLQNKYAQENNQHVLEELAKLKASKKENEDWIEFLKSQ